MAGVVEMAAGEQGRGVILREIFVAVYGRCFGCGAA